MEKKNKNSISKEVYVFVPGGDWSNYYSYLSMEDLLDENDVENKDIVAIYKLEEIGHMESSSPRYVRDKKYK